MGFLVSLKWGRKLIKTGSTLFHEALGRENLCAKIDLIFPIWEVGQIFILQIALYIFKFLNWKNADFFSCKDLEKPSSVRLLRVQMYILGLFSITIAPSSGILWPYRTMSGNASCKHLSSIILLCLWREQRSEMIIFIPGRLQGNLGNEPAKKREPSFHGSLVPTSYHFQPLHRANTCLVFSAVMTDWRFPVLVTGSGHDCDGQLRFSAQVRGHVSGQSNQSNLPTVRNETAVLAPEHSALGS